MCKIWVENKPPLVKDETAIRALRSLNLVTATKEKECVEEKLLPNPNSTIVNDNLMCQYIYIYIYIYIWGRSRGFLLYLKLVHSIIGPYIK